MLEDKTMLLECGIMEEVPMVFMQVYLPRNVVNHQKADGTSGVTYDKNFCVNTRSSCFYMTFGRFNNITNNILFSPDTSVISLVTADRNFSDFTLTNNIFVARNARFLGGQVRLSTYFFNSSEDHQYTCFFSF